MRAGHTRLLSFHVCLLLLALLLSLTSGREEGESWVERGKGRDVGMKIQELSMPWDMRGEGCSLRCAYFKGSIGDLFLQRFLSPSFWTGAGKEGKGRHLTWPKGKGGQEGSHTQFSTATYPAVPLPPSPSRRGPAEQRSRVLCSLFLFLWLPSFSPNPNSCSSHRSSSPALTLS